MPFWSRSKTASSPSDTYMADSRFRMEETSKGVELIEEYMKRDDIPVEFLHSIYKIQMELANAQANAIPPPYQAMEDHKWNYWKIMDFQARKIKDLIDTGGQNLYAIAAEEDAFGRETDEHAKQVHQEYTDARKQWGLSPRDLS